MNIFFGGGLFDSLYDIVNLIVNLALFLDFPLCSFKQEEIIPNRSDTKLNFLLVKEDRNMFFRTQL